MKVELFRNVAAAAMLAGLATFAVSAQIPPPPPPPSIAASAHYSTEQLAQMLAPIALYPDPLLGQVLMAATYPLEVVQADRWLEIPANAALKGDQLAAALNQQPWDPSVKSLVAYPQILQMLDGNLTWTEQLGDAFLADQAAVMDGVQQLRQRAEQAGKLASTPQQVVTTAPDQIVTILPASPEIVYVPVYDPGVVYGAWPYGAFPPYYFPDYFNGVFIDGFLWFGFPIFGPFWGWNHWDWGNHRIDIDRDRFAGLNHGRSPPGGGAWAHDPSHRRDVPYRNLGTRQQFEPQHAAPNANQESRGFSNDGSSAARRAPPSAESYGRGSDVRVQSQRGMSSRMSAPSSGGGARRR